MPKKGRDIEIPLALSFEEAFSGLTTNITVNRSEQCSRCQGAGDTGGPVVQCPTCKGTGQVMRTGGRLQFSQGCTDCEGTGRRRQPCSLCNGKGVTPKTEQVENQDTGGRGYRFACEGSEKRPRRPLGAEPGDLFILTNVGKHKFLERKGDNVYIVVPITVPEARHKIEVPTSRGQGPAQDPVGNRVRAEIQVASAVSRV